MTDKLHILRLSANAEGRDFVVGDLHGCRQDLDDLLAAADFDTQHDRLFLVGDLIDRGPDSPGCLDLLDAPWCFAVRGNHEQLLIEGAQHPGALMDWLCNGGNWALADGHIGEQGEYDGWLREQVARLDALPDLIVVGSGAARFQIVHAELPAGVTDADLDAPHLPLQITREHLLWSRRIFGRLDQPDTRPGLSPTYCGHTIGESIRHADGHICLDTGSFLAQNARFSAVHGLTLLAVDSQQVWQGMGTRDQSLDDMITRRTTCRN